MKHAFCAPVAERTCEEWQLAFHKAKQEITQDCQRRGMINSSGRFNRLASAALDAFRSACDSTENG